MEQLLINWEIVVNDSLSRAMPHSHQKNAINFWGKNEVKVLMNNFFNCPMNRNKKIQVNKPWNVKSSIQSELYTEIDEHI